MRVSKNEDLNGYIMTFDNDHGYYVQFWYDQHVRSWYAAAHDEMNWQVGDSKFCYRKDDIIELALRIVDRAVNNDLDQY